MALPKCQDFDGTEEKSFCCTDVFKAIRLTETRGMDNEGLGAVGASMDYGPYQLTPPFVKDGKRICGNYYPAIGGYGGSPRIFATPRILITHNMVLNDKKLSEHLMCCAWRRYSATADAYKKMKCCKEGPPHSLPTPAIGQPPFPQFTRCTGTWTDLVRMARNHNGGPRGYKKDSTLSYIEDKNKVCFSLKELQICECERDDKGKVKGLRKL